MQEARRLVSADWVLKRIQEGKKVRLKNAHINGYINLSKLDLPIKTVARTDFQKNILGLSTECKIVSSSINISDTEFKGTVIFFNCLFDTDARFKGATFSRNAEFMGATFSRNAEFMGATFSGNAVFEGATFNEDTWFNGATFSGNAVFEGATFRYAGFEGATFSRNVGFRRATFSRNVGFRRATFSGNAVFEGATFNEDTWFSGATFRYAEFKGATFNEDTWFSGATFRYAEFKGATFNEDTWFNGATFRYAGFKGATFNEDAWFEGATFNGYAWFSGARFEGDVLTFRGAAFTNPAPQENACRRAKNVLERNGDRDEAGYHFYREMEAKRKQKESNYSYFDHEALLVCKELDIPSRELKDLRKYLRYNILEYFFIQVIFGYGVHPLRIWGFWIFVAVIFAILFWMGSGINDSANEPLNNILEYLWFSITVAVTPGFGGNKPASLIYFILACVEAIFGTFMWAAFVTTFARKYMR